MHSNFLDYVRNVKPRLDEAFYRTLISIIGDDDLDGQNFYRETLLGGKKIRGCLLCMVTEAAGGSIDSALPRAVALELIHAASLIHDDFVDQDIVRRGMPATWTLTGARRAVLLGDLIFASTIDMMTRLSREDGRIASAAIAQLARGAFHEPLDPAALADAIASGRFKPAIYEKIIALKTGILFGAACQAGALSAGLGRRASLEWMAYGQRIGEAYQMADDLHDVRRYGNNKAEAMHSVALAELVPALLYFSKEIEPLVMRLLVTKNLNVDNELLSHFLTVGERMEQAIERRVESAAANVPGNFSGRSFSDLLCRAPRDLIAMFNKEAAF